MTQKHYTAQIWKRQDIVWLVIGVFVAGIFMGVVISCAVFANAALAEDLTYDCWTMCQPGSEVMIRAKPSRQAEAVGAAGCGERLRTDWREKDGWLHLVDVSNETGDGWIHMGYVVFQEPRTVGAEMTVAGCRRVACRKSMNGKRTAWAKSGSRVVVYMIADEWAVTDRGYIQAAYLRGD